MRDRRARSFSKSHFRRALRSAQTLEVKVVQRVKLLRFEGREVAASAATQPAGFSPAYL